MTRSRITMVVVSGMGLAAQFVLSTALVLSSTSFGARGQSWLFWVSIIPMFRAMDFGFQNMSFRGTAELHAADPALPPRFAPVAVTGMNSFQAMGLAVFAVQAALLLTPGMPEALRLAASFTATALLTECYFILGTGLVGLERVIEERLLRVLFFLAPAAAEFAAARAFHDPSLAGLALSAATLACWLAIRYRGRAEAAGRSGLRDLAATWRANRHEMFDQFVTILSASAISYGAGPVAVGLLPHAEARFVLLLQQVGAGSVLLFRYQMDGTRRALSGLWNSDAAKAAQLAFSTARDGALGALATVTIGYWVVSAFFLLTAHLRFDALWPIALVLPLTYGVESFQNNLTILVMSVAFRRFALITAISGTLTVIISYVLVRTIGAAGVFLAPFLAQSVSVHPRNIRLAMATYHIPFRRLLTAFVPVAAIAAANLLLAWLLHACIR